MNINILKEFNLIFLIKINIIYNRIYVNYTYKRTLICVFLLILSFFLSFLNIFMNFELFLFYRYFCQNIHRYLSDIFNISVKSKYRYIRVYRYFKPWLCLV